MVDVYIPYDKKNSWQNQIIVHSYHSVLIPKGGEGKKKKLFFNMSGPQVTRSLQTMFIGHFVSSKPLKESSPKFNIYINGIVNVLISLID